MASPLFLALLAAQAASAPPTAAPPLPADWSALPEPVYRRPPRFGNHLALFASREHEAGRCDVAPNRHGYWTLKVDLAVLVGTDGAVLDVIPAAVGCPTVERYAAKAMAKGLKGKVIGPPGPAPAWYRTDLRFSWTG